MAALQRTLALIKPDAVDKADAIVEMAQQAGFTVLEVSEPPADQLRGWPWGSEGEGEAAVPTTRRCPTHPGRSVPCGTERLVAVVPCAVARRQRTPAVGWLRLALLLSCPTL